MENNPGPIKDLNEFVAKIDEMKKNHYTAKAIQDAGWAMFINSLDYKCELQGSHLIKINQFLASSKTCSSCGIKKKSLDLKMRQFACDNCNNSIHRDINAAINIDNWGRQQYAIQTGREPPKVPVDLTMCILLDYGLETSSHSKQEATKSLVSW